MRRSAGPPRGSPRAQHGPAEHFARFQRQDGEEEPSLDSIARARSGDLDAFEDLVREHTPSAYRLAAAIVGHDGADDVVQDAFLQAWRNVDRLRDPGRFRPWLFRIVANAARSSARAGRRVREVDLQAVPADAFAAERPELGAVEARAIVERAFRGLSIDHRVVIGLHYGSGLSLAEVAAALEIPVGTAKSRLAAALAALRTTVGERA